MNFYIYLEQATLKKRKQKLEKDEFIKEVKPFEKKEMLKMIKKGVIQDGKTIIAVLFELFLLA